MEKNKVKLLRAASMERYLIFDDVIQTLGLHLHKQYQETNQHVLEKTNNYVTEDGLGGFRTTSYRDTSYAQTIVDDNCQYLYPKKNFITVSEVLNTVNQATGFLNEFQHHENRYLKERPENKVLIASLVAMGCHFSPTQFAKLSKINDTALVTTVNQYLSIDNARQACNIIEDFVKKMPLADLFVEDFGVQTSSDGQKWPVAKESRNANRSFKYGGKDAVLSAYSFIDSRNLFFHSEVISGAEREAHYMLDGVLRN